MELIKTHYMETPTGIEVIKRLLRKGFIEEFDDPDDKRSKRVRITEMGKHEYHKTLLPLRKVIELMAGPMQDREKIQLVSLLNELNGHHVAQHQQAKTMTLDQLLEKLHHQKEASNG